MNLFVWVNVEYVCGVMSSPSTLGHREGGKDWSKVENEEKAKEIAAATRIHIAYIENQCITS